MRCVEHDTEMEWMDGSALPGYAPWFRPLGWVCPCNPGHLPGAARHGHADCPDRADSHEDYCLNGRQE